MQRDFCENERKAIETRLSVILDAPVILRFVLSSSLASPSINLNKKIETPASDNEIRKRNRVAPVDVSATENDQSPVPSARPNLGELRREVTSNEIAQQIQDLFSAELSEVKQTSQIPNLNSNRGYEYE